MTTLIKTARGTEKLHRAVQFVEKINFAREAGF